jgi:phospholipase C
MGLDRGHGSVRAPVKGALMPEVDRRRFLQIAGGGAALSVLTPSIARAASIPAFRRSGSLADVEHVVVLMQENRSFDHYFGTMQGVRGYGDPHPAVLRNGKPVWHQPHGKPTSPAEVLPFRPDLDDLGLAFLQDIDHGWESQHGAFAQGFHDQWVRAKSTPVTMAHLERNDIPFHYALADAFTVCDAYHCSLLGPTDPNRYYLWSGWVGNDGKGGGPVVDNAEAGYSWKTYPERLQKAGIDWRIYQDEGDGLDAAHAWGWTIADPFIGNYGDTSLLYFDSYRKSKPGDALYARARTGTTAKTGGAGTFFDLLAQDVQNDALPQVSWIVAPEAFTEHPNWPANYGAWYVSKVLDALTSNPAVWAKTALFLTFDENDGFFDHVVPPYPNVGGLSGDSTVGLAHELYQGKNGKPGPYGLGVRVPMTVVSPWSTGGWVCSETFDHTSIIRFIEQRFGVHEPNITRWRRTVCGDLTSAFDFSRPTAFTPIPVNTSSYEPPANDTRHADYVPRVPAHQHLPHQEPGVRPSRALGYRLDVEVTVSEHHLDFTIANGGRLGAQLQARSNDVAGAPFTYTVGAGHTLKPRIGAHGRFDVSFHGPDGYFRRFAGDTSEPVLETRTRRLDGHLEVTLRNRTDHALHVHVANAYDHDRTVRVPKRSHTKVRVGLSRTHGWYDVLLTVKGQPHVVRALAGRVENGRPGTSDPQLGR